MNEPGTRDLAARASSGAQVFCLLKRGAIAVARCVEWQTDNGCHCDQALVSIRAVGILLAEEPPQATAEQLRVREEKLEALRVLKARAEEIERQPPPAPPVKEEENMPMKPKLESITDEEIRAAFPKHQTLSAVRAHFGVGMNPLRERVKALGLLPPRGGSKPRKAKSAPAMIPPARAVAADPNDVVALLQRRLEHHQTEAAKCQRALEALQ